MNKSNNKRKFIIIIIVMAISILLIIGGFLIGNLALKNDEELAKQILEETGMKEYLSEAFVPGVKENEELLSNKKYLEIFNSESLAKYQLQYSTDKLAVTTYVKYDDFATEFEKKNGITPDFKKIKYSVAFTDLVKLEENLYQYTQTNISKCNESDLSNCYVTHDTYLVPKGVITFSSLVLENDTITGNILNEYIFEDRNVKFNFNGKFEFKFKETDDTYTPESFVVTSVGELEVVE